MTVEVLQGGTTLVLTPPPGRQTVVVADPPTPRTVEIVSRGPQGGAGPAGPQGGQGVKGDKGDPGEVLLGGYQTEIATPGVSDLVQFSSSNKWINSNLLDGGNF